MTGEGTRGEAAGSGQTGAEGGEPLSVEEARASARALMRSFGPAYWRVVDQARAFPTEFFEAVGKAGYFATLIPEAYGGVGAGVGTASVLVEEVNRAGGDASTLNAQMAIAGALVRGGTAEQKRQHLPRIADGTLRLLTVAATEPDSGADMSTLESRAVQEGGEGGDWVLDAQKVLISLAEHTDLLLLLVRASAGPTLFLLDRREFDAARLVIHPIELISNRLTTTLFVEALRVPDSARVGEPGAGLRCLMGGFAPRRVLAAAEALGNARFLLDLSLEHAKTRRVFRRLIGENQGVQYPLAQAYSHVEAADLMRWDAAARIASGDAAAGGRSALAKLLASEALAETTRAALTTFGGWGLASEYHLERKLREATVFGFNNLLWTYVAERVLGLPKGF